MNNYIELTINTGDGPLREMLVAQLLQKGYDGFEESETELKAFVPEEIFKEEELNIIFKNYDLKYSKSIINKQNWNELWESNFEPVQIDDFVGIRASFHPPFANIAHEIVITPKMSFGTGHHATTYSVMQLMRKLNFKGATVFDFGTGTGILAILAEKLGAAKLLAVDNDDWCIENASENILVNSCNNIDIQKVDKLILSERYQIILANINKNIILHNIKTLAAALEKNGELVLSGLLKEDEVDIQAACRELNLVHKATLERSGWIACLFADESL